MIDKNSYLVPPSSSILNRSQSLNEGFVIIPQLKIHGSHLKDNEKTNQHSSIKRCCHIRISKLELTSDSRDKIPTSIKFSVGLNKIRRTLITSPIDLLKTLEEVVLSQSSQQSQLINNNINDIQNNTLDYDNNSRPSFLPISTSSIVIPTNNNNNSVSTTTLSSSPAMNLSPKKHHLHVDTQFIQSHSPPPVINSPSSKKTYLYPLDIRFSFHYDHSLKEYDDFIKITLLKCTPNSTSNSSSSSNNKHRGIPISYSTINLSQILQQGEFISDLDMIPINIQNNTLHSASNNSSGNNDYINNGGLVSNNSGINSNNNNNNGISSIVNINGIGNQINSSNINNNVPSSSVINISVCSVPKEIENIENAQEYQLNDIALSDDENLFFDSDSNDEDDEEVISYQDVPYHFNPIKNTSNSPLLFNSQPFNQQHDTDNDQDIDQLQQLPQSLNQQHVHTATQQQNQQQLPPFTASEGLLSQRLLEIRDLEHHSHHHHHSSSGSSHQNEPKKNKKSKLQKLSSLIKPITIKTGNNSSRSKSNNNNTNNNNNTINNSNNINNNNNNNNNNLQDHDFNDSSSSESSSDVYEPANIKINNKLQLQQQYYNQIEEGDDEKDDEKIDDYYNSTPSNINSNNNTLLQQSPFKLSNDKAFLINNNVIGESKLPHSGGIVKPTFNHILSSPLHLSSSSVPPITSAPISSIGSNGNLENILNQLSTSEKPIHLLFINALRRRGKKIEQVIEQSKSLKSSIKVVSTRSNLEITTVFKSILSKLYNEQTKIIIAGSDSYVNAIMRCYVTLISLKPRGWNPFLFYLLPLGSKSNDISLQLASNDQTYSTLFSNNPEWKRIFDQIEPPTPEQSIEIENKITQYIFGSRILNHYKFPIGEALITTTSSSSTTTAIPFIKGIQINQITSKPILTTTSSTTISSSTTTTNNNNNVGGGIDELSPVVVDEQSDGLQVQLDYWVQKKKGTDHIVFKSVLQQLKLTRLSTISNSIKIPHPSPSDNSFSILVVHKYLNKKKNMLTRLTNSGNTSGSGSSSSSNNQNNLSSSNNSGSGGNSSSNSSKQKKESTSSNNEKNSISNGSSGDQKNKEQNQDKHIKEQQKEQQIQTIDKDTSFVVSSTKLMCGPIASSSSSSSSSSNSETIYFKVLIDGVEFSNVKFLSISPQWSTHVKYFPIQSFSDQLEQQQQDHDIYSD